MKRSGFHNLDFINGIETSLYEFQHGQQGFFFRIMKVAQRKLTMLDAANTLEDLRVPPASRLEALQGDWKGQHSIRVNDQCRFCFVWTESGPADGEFTDYH